MRSCSLGTRSDTKMVVLAICVGLLRCYAEAYEAAVAERDRPTNAHEFARAVHEHATNTADDDPAGRILVDCAFRDAAVIVAWHLSLQTADSVLLEASQRLSLPSLFNTGKHNYMRALTIHLFTVSRAKDKVTLGDALVQNRSSGADHCEASDLAQVSNRTLQRMPRSATYRGWMAGLNGNRSARRSRRPRASSTCFGRAPITRLART